MSWETDAAHCLRMKESNGAYFKPQEIKIHVILTNLSAWQFIFIFGGLDSSIISSQDNSAQIVHAYIYLVPDSTRICRGCVALSTEIESRIS